MSGSFRCFSLTHFWHIADSPQTDSPPTIKQKSFAKDQQFLGKENFVLTDIISLTNPQRPKFFFGKSRLFSQGSITWMRNIE
jgi:hypothetical protein